MTFALNNMGKFEELLDVIDYMMREDRKNPFPRYGFLIEDIAYYDTSDYLKNLRNEIMRKLDEPVMMLDSVKFDFS